MKAGLDIAALHGFIDESLESLRCIEPSLIALEGDTGNIDIVNEIFRPVHSIKGNSGFFGLTNINRFSHRLENLLDFIRKGEILINKEVINLLLTGFDQLKAIVNRVYENPDDVELSENDEDILRYIERISPKKWVGTIDSIITLERLVNEAIDAGLDVFRNSLISGLLNSIEKTNEEIRKLISDHKASSLNKPINENQIYSFKNRDYTEEVKCLHEVAAYLGLNRPVPADVLKRYDKALNKAAELFSGNEEIAGKIIELEDMQGFLDDELLATSADYATTNRQLLQSLISCFDVETGEDKQVPRVGEILVSRGLVEEEQIANALKGQKKIGEILVEQGVIDKEDLEKALKEQSRQKLDTHLQHNKIARESTKTIRIDQDRLDVFADSVGELFISVDAFNFLSRHFSDNGLGFKDRARLDNAVQSLDSVVNKLHHDVMAIRRIPIKSLFQRFPRVVRELAATLGKEIEITTVGEDTVIDKDLLEKIENPLVHLLRNSVDHGIEQPEARIAAGKPRSGSIRVTASADEDSMYLKIFDDGKGIDPQKMKAVAVKKGFMTASEVEKLSERDLVNLIFRPGFSSADKVSDVSGRGVGMDVVLSALRECNGAIDVDSRINAGTTVSIKIPISKTLITKDAIIIRSGGQTFAVASEDVESALDLGDDANTFFQANGHVLRVTYKGSILGVVDLSTFFFPDSGAPAPDNRVILACPIHEVALLVDQVISHQKIVLKSFDARYQQFKALEGISGYTTLGNEEIVLIIDVRQIVEYSQRDCFVSSRNVQIAQKTAAGPEATVKMNDEDLVKSRKAQIAEL